MVHSVSLSNEVVYPCTKYNELYFTWFIYIHNEVDIALHVHAGHGGPHVGVALGHDHGHVPLGLHAAAQHAPHQLQPRPLHALQCVQKIRYKYPVKEISFHNILSLATKAFSLLKVSTSACFNT